MNLYTDHELLYMIRQNAPGSYEELFHRYEKMLMKLAYGSQFGVSEYVEEAVDIARVSFQQAVECYRENMGSGFSTFLHKVVSINLSNYRRQLFKEIRGHYSYDSIEQLETSAVYKKVCEDALRNDQVREFQQVIDLAYDTMSLDEKKALNLLKAGYTQHEVASKLHISRYRVQYIIRKLKGKYLEIR